MYNKTRHCGAGLKDLMIKNKNGSEIVAIIA